MKKILFTIMCLIILCTPIKVLAESENNEDKNSTEITAETWLTGIGILAAGGFAYAGNKLGKKLGSSKNKKKK